MTSGATALVPGGAVALRPVQNRAGDPGIEPGVAVLETTVLPIHQSPGAQDCRGWHLTSDNFQTFR